VADRVSFVRNTEDGDRLCPIANLQSRGLPRFIALSSFVVASSSPTMRVPADTFWEIGLGMANSNPKCRKSKTSHRRFRATFGTGPEMCSELWHRLEPETWGCGTGERGVAYKHLLWALLLMKVYGTENFLRGVAKAHEQTFRKWTWMFIGKIAALKPKVVRFPTTANYI
jgi:hypothetical protein